MNIATILYYGQKDLSSALAKVSAEQQNTAGACGKWSIHDVLAHLYSYEQYMYEVVTTILFPSAPTPILEEMKESHEGFSERAVLDGKNMSFAELMEKQKKAHEELLVLLKQIPVETLSKPGTLPWYGGEYALDDYLVYTGYGHKKEHAAQIEAFLS